jgi:hypothetical protein
MVSVPSFRPPFLLTDSKLMVSLPGFKTVPALVGATDNTYFEALAVV